MHSFQIWYLQPLSKKLGQGQFKTNNNVINKNYRCDESPVLDNFP